MTLRDLTEDELKTLQKRCMSEFSNWLLKKGWQRVMEMEEAWKAGYSSGLKVKLVEQEVGNRKQESKP